MQTSNPAPFALLLWQATVLGVNPPQRYFKFPQKRWMRRQASSTSSVLVA
jgi:hypothetical protein